MMNYALLITILCQGMIVGNAFQNYVDSRRVVALPKTSTSPSSVNTGYPSLLMMNKKTGKKKSSKAGVGGFGVASSKQARSGSSSISGGPAWAKTFPFAGQTRPGKMSPQRVVTSKEIMLPDYAITRIPKGSKPMLPWVVEVKKPDEIEKMRAAGALARHVLDTAGRAVAVGVKTDEIDRIVHEEAIKHGAYPSPLNYHGFPKSCCTSVNEVICHGIPDDRALEDGDVINIDITVYLNGFHGDCSEMFYVGEGEPSNEVRDLLQTTYDCWIKSCNFVLPGRDYKDIGVIIEDHVTPRGYSSVRNFCGHGIGSVFHTNPNILHYKNQEPNGQMAPGHTFTIEPMICEGSARALSWPDQWTATTSDGGRSVQFEHTLLITKDGVEALTGKTDSSPVQFWERESEIHQGIWLGTSASARQRQDAINEKHGIVPLSTE